MQHLPPPTSGKNKLTVFQESFRFYNIISDFNSRTLLFVKTLFFNWPNCKIPTFLITVLLFGACTKNSTQTTLEEHQLTGKLSSVISSLKKKQIDFKEEAKANVENLIAALETKKAWIEEGGYVNKEYFLLIPLSTTYKTKNNKGKKVNNYVLARFSNDNTLKSTEVIQYHIKEDKEYVKGMVSNYFCDHSFSGTITFLDISGRFRYEVEIDHKGTKKYVLLGPSLEDPASTGSSASSICTNWYLITIVYYTDGTTYTYEEYLGQTCNDCPPATTILSEGGICGQPNSDTGPGGGPLQETVSTQKDWVVKKSVFGYMVVATVRMDGVMVPGEIGGGHFTGAQHLNALVLSRDGGFSWTLSGATVSYNNIVTTHQVSGVVKDKSDGSEEFIPTKAERFLFPDVFP